MLRLQLTGRHKMIIKFINNFLKNQEEQKLINSLLKVLENERVLLNVKTLSSIKKVYVINKKEKIHEKQINSIFSIPNSLGSNHPRL